MKDKFSHGDKVKLFRISPHNMRLNDSGIKVGDIGIVRFIDGDGIPYVKYKSKLIYVNQDDLELVEEDGDES